MNYISRSFLIISTLTLLIVIVSSPIFADFDIPKYNKKNILPDGKKLSCYVYPNLAVLEYDKNEMGAADINIRYHYKIKDNSICQQNFLGEKISLENLDGYFYGVKKHFIFVASPDTFGGIGKFTVYDAKSGKKIFASEYHAKKEFAVNQSSLIFYRPLKLTCVPDEKELTCWNKLLKENGFDPAVKNTSVNCNDAIKNLPSVYQDPEHMLQITVKVKLENFNHPKLKYLGGNATCQLAP